MTFKNEFECQHPQEIPLNAQKWKYSLLCVKGLFFLVLSFLPLAPHWGGGGQRVGFANEIFNDFSNNQLDPLFLVFRYLCPEFANRLDVWFRESCEMIVRFVLCKTGLWVCFPSCPVMSCDWHWWARHHQIGTGRTGFVTQGQMQESYLKIDDWWHFQSSTTKESESKPNKWKDVFQVYPRFSAAGTVSSKDTTTIVLLWHFTVV